MKIYKKIIIGIVIGIVLLLFLSSIRTVDRNDIDDTVDTVPALTGDVDLGNSPVAIENFTITDFTVESFIVENFAVENFAVENFVIEEKLTEAEIELLIDGIEKYDKGMQFILDQCLSTDSDENFVILMYTFNELENHTEIMYLYNEAMEGLINAGYGSHVRLGPIIEESLILSNSVLICYQLMLDALD